MASNVPDDGDGFQTAQAARPGRVRLVVGLALLAFIGGLAVMAWAIAYWPGGTRSGRGPADPAGVASIDGNGAGLAGPAMQEMPLAATTRAPSQVLSGVQQDARMLDIEQRMTRVAVAAQAASGYANRAEAMMIAFAARRALDAGAPLGYVEGQLRLLFGDAQPKAVATIVNAAAEPVTLSRLRAGLETIGTAVERGSPAESWWSGAMRELRGLAVIRPAGAPSPEPRQRLARARLHVESGQIEAAIEEISVLPPRPETTAWLEQARRYNEAHRALDVIEAAAILEPRAAPIVAPAAQPGAPAAAGAAGR